MIHADRRDGKRPALDLRGGLVRDGMDGVAARRRPEHVQGHAQEGGDARRRQDLERRFDIVALLPLEGARDVLVRSPAAPRGRIH